MSTQPGSKNPAWRGGLERYAVEPSTGCWLWLGYVDALGYGRTNQRLYGTGLPHRAIYERERGPVPPGFELDHLCRVPSCVNPAHLEAVTHAENIRRGASATKTHCAQGHAYTPENTRVTPQGSRRCRACHREEARKKRSLA